MKKTRILIPVAIFMLGASLVLGYNQLSRNIYDRTDCESFNIDHIELRTGINIPNVSNSVCEFDKLQNSKTSIFSLAGVEIEKYVNANGFELVDGKYIRSGDKEANRWEAELDPETATLRVEIFYGI
ncbi:MAG: hypothetical protein R2824_22635 [Saprospiraceae bacterium]|nr:hypothetical protein [Lewinella sp.]